MAKWDDPTIKKYMLRGMSIAQAIAQYEEDQQIELQSEQIAALVASTGTVVPTDPTPPPTDTTGVNGESAYQLWLDAGNTGTVQDFLDSLVGAPGADGLSAYEQWEAAGNVGDTAAFLASLKGAKGDTGAQAGLEIASLVIAGPTNPTANNTYATQGQIVVPAGSPAHLVEIVGGLPVQVQTGIQPAETLYRVDMAIFDELNALVAYSMHIFSQGSTAVTKGKQTTLPVQASMPANPGGPKTYTLQVRAQNINANNATLAVLIGGGVFPSRTFRAVAR